MTTISNNQYEFNSDTRIISFKEDTCWQCKGKGEVVRGISCPHYGKKVRGKFPGGKCPECGATNSSNHKMIGSKVVTCEVCSGKGSRQLNAYDSVDARPLLNEITFVLLNGLRVATLNESYFGIGLIGGCTDYGRYISESALDGKFDVETFKAKVILPSMNDRNKSVQTIGSFVYKGSDNENHTVAEVIRYAFVKLNRDGWSVICSNTKQMDAEIEKAIESGVVKVL